MQRKILYTYVQKNVWTLFFSIFFASSFSGTSCIIEFWIDKIKIGELIFTVLQLVYNIIGNGLQVHGHSLELFIKILCFLRVLVLRLERWLNIPSLKLSPINCLEKFTFANILVAIG